MSFDDWRGLEKIRIPKRAPGERQSETQAIAQKLVHAKRRANGCGVAQSGGLWARQIKSWALSGAIEGRRK